MASRSMIPQNASDIINTGIRQEDVDLGIDILTQNNTNFINRLINDQSSTNRKLRTDNAGLTRDIGLHIRNRWNNLGKSWSIPPYRDSTTYQDRANMAKVAYVTHYLLAIYRTLRFRDTNFNNQDIDAETVGNFISQILYDLRNNNFINDDELFNIILDAPATLLKYNGQNGSPNIADDANTMQNSFRAKWREWTYKESDETTPQVGRDLSYNSINLHQQYGQQTNKAGEIQKTTITTVDTAKHHNANSGQVANANAQQYQVVQNTGPGYATIPLFFQAPGANYSSGHSHESRESSSFQKIPPITDCCKEEKSLDEYAKELQELENRLYNISRKKPLDIIIDVKVAKKPAIYEDIYDGLVSKMEMWLDGNEGYIKNIGDDDNREINDQISKFYDEEVAKHKDKALSAALSKESNKQKIQITDNVKECIRIKYDYVNAFFENSVKYLAIGKLKDGEKSKKLNDEIENARNLFAEGKKGDAKKAMEVIFKDSKLEKNDGFIYNVGKFFNSLFSSNGYDMDDVLENARIVNRELFAKWKILDIKRKDVEQLALLPDDKNPREFIHKSKHRDYKNYSWDSDDISKTLLDTSYTEEAKILCLDDLINKLEGVERSYIGQVEDFIINGKGDGKSIFSGNDKSFGEIDFVDEDGESSKEAPNATKNIFTVGASGSTMYVPVPNIMDYIMNSVSNISINPIEESLDYRDVRVAWMDNIKSKLKDIEKVEDLRMITNFEIIAVLAGGHSNFYREFKNICANGKDMKQVVNMVFTYASVTFPELTNDLETFIETLSQQYGYNKDNLYAIYDEIKTEAKSILTARANDTIHNNVGIDKWVTTRNELYNITYNKKNKEGKSNSIVYTKQKTDVIFNGQNDRMNNIFTQDIGKELNKYAQERIDLLSNYNIDLTNTSGNINLLPRLDGTNIMTERVVNNDGGGVIFNYNNNNSNDDVNAAIDNIINTTLDTKLKDKHITDTEYTDAVKAMNELRPKNLSKYLQKWGREEYDKISAKAIVKEKINLDNSGSIITIQSPNFDIELPSDCVDRNGIIYGDKLYKFLNETQKNIRFVNKVDGKIEFYQNDLEQIKIFKPEIIDEVVGKLYNTIPQNDRDNIQNFDMSNVMSSGISMMSMSNIRANDRNPRNSVFASSNVDRSTVLRNGTFEKKLYDAIDSIKQDYKHNGILCNIIESLPAFCDFTSKPDPITQDFVKTTLKNALKLSIDDSINKSIGLVRKSNGKYYLNPGKDTAEYTKLCYAQERSLKDCKTMDEAILLLRKIKDGYVKTGAGNVNNPELKKYITNATDDELRSLVYVMIEDKGCPYISKELRGSIDKSPKYTVMPYDPTQEMALKESIFKLKKEIDVVGKRSESLKRRDEIDNMARFSEIGYSPYSNRNSEDYMKWVEFQDKRDKNSKEEDNKSQNHHQQKEEYNRKPTSPIIGGYYRK